MILIYKDGIIFHPDEIYKAYRTIVAVKNGKNTVVFNEESSINKELGLTKNMAYKFIRDEIINNKEKCGNLVIDLVFLQETMKEPVKKLV